MPQQPWLSSTADIRQRLALAEPGIAELPHTLCHRDAFRRNLRARQEPDGQPQTVALDWAMVGIGILGEELVRLFGLTLLFFSVEIERIAEMDALIFAGYVEGLRAAGWQGDARLARFGFTALAALLMGVGDPAIKLPSVARRIAALPAGAEPPPLLGPSLPHNLALQRHPLPGGERFGKGRRFQRGGRQGAHKLCKHRLDDTVRLSG